MTDLRNACRVGAVMVMHVFSSQFLRSMHNIRTCASLGNKINSYKYSYSYSYINHLIASYMLHVVTMAAILHGCYLMYACEHVVRYYSYIVDQKKQAGH